MAASSSSSGDGPSRITVTYTKDGRKSRKKWSILDGTMVVEGGRKCKLLDEMEDLVEMMILSQHETTKMKSLGWLGGKRGEDEDEVVLEFSESLRVIVLAKEEDAFRTSTTRRKATSSYQLPKATTEKKRLPPQTQRPSTEKDERRLSLEKDEWRDDEVFDTETCFARAVKMARAEGVGKRGDNDDQILRQAAKQAAKRSPSLVGEEERTIVSPSTKSRSSQQQQQRQQQRDDEEACIESAVVVDERTAASMAQKWLEDKTRSIEFAYDVGWKPTKAAKLNINRTCRNVDEDESVEPLRAFMFKKLRVDGMARGVRARMTDLIDLILDPTLFSYRLARAVLENDDDLDFLAIKRVLHDVVPTSSSPGEKKGVCSETLLDSVKSSLAKAQDRSLIEELRNEERPVDDDDDDLIIPTQETRDVIVMNEGDDDNGRQQTSSPIQIIDEDDFTKW